MPVKAPPHADCLHFAAALKTAFEAAGLHDPTDIGAMVALAQESPPREDLPYHPAVVNAWLQGRCVPDAATFSALHDMLSDVAATHFEDAYEAALLHAPHASEASLLLTHRMEKHGFVLRSLAEELTAHGCYGSHGKRYDDSTLSYWRSGKADIPASVIPALDAILPATDGPSLATLRQLGAPTAEEILAKAAASTQLPRILRYMRRAVDLSPRQMAESLSMLADLTPPLSAHTVQSWELLEHKPTAATPFAQKLNGHAPMELYGSVLREHGFSAWVEEHQSQINDMYKQRLERHRWVHRAADSMETQTPDDHLHAAAVSPSIHDTFRHIRLALKFSTKQMAQAINAELPQHGSISPSAVAGWEGIDGKGMPHIPRAVTFAGTDPITVYCTIMRKQGHADWVEKHQEAFTKKLRDRITNAPVSPQAGYRHYIANQRETLLASLTR